MSLNQKYTWKDFLKENPEHREKKTKRTSAEGKKAFEAAFKAHAKKHLEGRLTRFEKDVEVAKKKRAALSAKSTEARKAKRIMRVKELNSQIGRIDAALGRYARQIEGNKAKQKSLK